MGHASHKMGHAFVTNCNNRRNLAMDGKWRPLKECQKSAFPEENQTPEGDTPDVSGPLKVNDLASGLGHDSEAWATKNPGALAGATGVNSVETIEISHRDTTPKRGRSAMSKYAPDAHKRAARMLGYALVRGTSDAWLDFATVIAARLTDQERAGLAFAALTSLDLDTRHMVAEAAMGGAGNPLPTFMDPADDAKWWARVASRDELETYCLAAYLAMPEARQAAFLRYANGRAAA